MRRIWIDDEDGCRCGSNGDGRFWKMLSLFWFLAAGIFAMLSFCLKRKNDKYRKVMFVPPVLMIKSEFSKHVGNSVYMAKLPIPSGTTVDASIHLRG